MVSGKFSIFFSNTGSCMSDFSVQRCSFGLTLLLKAQRALPLRSLSGFGFCRIHTFECALELLEATSLGALSGSLLRVKVSVLLAGNGSIKPYHFRHHFAEFGLLLDERFQSFHCRPLEKGCERMCEMAPGACLFRFRLRDSDECQDLPFLRASNSVDTLSRLA